MKTPVPILAFGLCLTSISFAVDPPPDGGYPNANTVEGEDALFSLTAGRINTAVGFQALYFNTSGGENTACGYYALHFNRTGVLIQPSVRWHSMATLLQ
jgi:hypothetical protein